MSRPSIVWCGHVLDDNPPVSVGPCFIAVARMKVAPGLIAGQKEKKNRVGAQMVIPNPLSACPPLALRPLPPPSCSLQLAVCRSLQGVAQPSL